MTQQSHYEFLSRAARRVALLCLTCFILAGLSGRHWSSPAFAAMRIDTLVIVTDSGSHKISIEIAESEADKSLGLMFRTALSDSNGMLFVYPRPQEITMWMRNTYISLDMVFVRADGTVHRIAASREPLSEDIVASQGVATFVLELAGGNAARLGLKAGDKLRHSLFRAAP